MAMATRPRWLANVALVLLPSFMTDLVRPEYHKTPKIHPTSYLDGLRGVASLIVSICHYTEDNHGYMIPSWGLTKNGSSFLQMPLIRLVYSGRPMVHVFFIISGFVLAYKPLKALQAHEIERCHEILASSAFRRPLRLFGPCVASTFAILVLSYAGFLYDPLPTLQEQFEDWGHALFHGITWPWSWDFDLRPTYDVHLWTIPIEFIHSMLLFMVILVLAPLRRVIRRAGLCLIMLYCLICGRWAAFEFLGGALIADIVLMQLKARSQILRSVSGLPLESDDILSKTSSNIELGNPSTSAAASSTCNPTYFLKRLLYALFVLAWLFVAGWPNENAVLTPGMAFLYHHTPEPYASLEQDDRAPQKFWFSLTAMGLVWAITQLRPLQRLFESTPAQYLGRISYALYIVHGPMLNMVQRRIVGHAASDAAMAVAQGLIEENSGSSNSSSSSFRPAVVAWGIKGWTGTDTPTQRTLAWFIGILVVWPLIIWVADIFWRLVDMPVIAVSRRVEEWCREK